MLNLKLKTIAQFINKSDIVIDMACDHAYLAIYLKKNNLCKEVYASDISKNALNNAKNNIKKSQVNIKTYLSDGFNNINIPNLNTVILSGLGTTTILNIIKNAPKTINKYIISTNNEYSKLIITLTKLGYYLNEEIVIKENNKYYPIMLFTKKNNHLSKFDLLYGISNNKEYYEYLLNKERNILNNIPKYKICTQLKHIKEIKNLKKILKERK